MSTSTLDILQHFERCRAALEAGQAQVEALLQSIRERVAVEEAYNKSLTRLTRSTMGVDGACARRARGRARVGWRGPGGALPRARARASWHASRARRARSPPPPAASAAAAAPAERSTEATMFEAVASLRGDFGNEAVQHA